MTLSQHLDRKSKRLQREAAQTAILEATDTEEILQAFIGSGTPDRNNDPTSTAYLPLPNELIVRATDRTAEILRTYQDNDDLPVAGLPHDHPQMYLTPSQAAAKWMAAYSVAGPELRAKLLGVEMEYAAAQILRNRIIANPNTTNTTTNYRAKTTLVTNTTTGVATGGTDKVKRVTWHGHSGFSLARYMGHRGLTGSQAVKVFAHLGIEFGKSAIVGGVYAGKAGTRGEPADVTPEQDDLIQAALQATSPIEAKEAKVAAKTKSDTDIQLVIRPAIQKPAAATPAPAKKMTKAEKRRAHDAKVTEAVKARKKANKA